MLLNFDFISKLQFFSPFFSLQMLDCHFIEDSDSATDFSFDSLPVKVACGYKFCDREEQSTQNQSQESRSSRSLSEKANIARRESHNQKGLFSNQKIYHESAIRKHISQMEKQYSLHKIDQAFKQAEKVKMLCEKLKEKLSQSEKKMVQKVERQMEDVKYYQGIINQEGWQLKKQKKNLKVSTKIQGNTVGVLVDAFLDVEIENFFSVLIEIDLMKKWMPFMESSELEKIVSRNCRIGHCINNFPIISKRESFFQGIGYDRVEHNGTILMFSRSINNNKQLQKDLDYFVKESPGAIQLDYKYIVLQYVPKTQKSGYLKMAINCDMKLSIPMFLLSPATQGFGVDFYNNILKISKNIKNSEWETKIKQNPEFFTFLQNRIKEYLAIKKQNSQVL